MEASTSSPPRNQFSPLPEIRRSFLSELFEDDLDNTAFLDIKDQIGQILRNQQVIFSVLSKILGSVQGIGQLGRAALSDTGLTVGGESVLGGNQLGRALPGTTLPFGGESVLGGNQLGRALSESRLTVGGESVEGGNQEEAILGNRQGRIQERELEPLASPQGSSLLLPEEDTDVLDGMDGVEDDIFYREILKIKGQSCSMGNFATKLVQKFFHTSELDNRNCMGSRGKVPLEPSKLQRVKHYTFRMYPTPSTQKEQQWKKCIIAIDESLRRKKK